MHLGDLDPDYYMREGCGVFALALAKVFPGGVIGIIAADHGERWSRSIPYEVTHVCYHLGGKFVDVKGIRSLDAMAEDLAVASFSLKGPFDPSAFKRRFVGNGDRFPLYGDAEEITTTVQFIERNRDRYDPSSSR